MGVLCVVGMHKWSNWTYEHDGNCLQVRRCTRDKCTKKETQNCHVWGEWSLDAKKSCVLKRTCSRCGQVESGRSNHLWNQWAYVANDSCVLKRICNRCGQVESRKDGHVWGEWEYRNLENITLELPALELCKQVSVCARCKQEQNRILHVWGDLKYVSSKKCIMSKYCQRCGTKDSNEEIKHKWGEWEYESPTSCKLVRKCKRCGEKMMGEEQHNWGEATYDFPESCILVSKCSRCSEKLYRNSGKEVHNWGEWNATPPLGMPKRVCRHCRKSELDISGKWVGTSKWNNISSEKWELSLEQANGELKGTLLVSLVFNGQITKVLQTIIGNIDKDKVSFHSLSVKFLEKGAYKKYYPYIFSGVIIDNGKFLEGNISSDKISGTPGTITLSIEKTKRMNNVFISYSHKDSEWLERLKVHLKPYERIGEISSWDDTRINVGGRWREEINHALVSAKVAVLIVSPDFLASDFIAKHELPPLLENAKKGGVIIVWVAVSCSAYHKTPIKDYQCANEPNKPLDSLERHEQNNQFVKICDKILQALEHSV